MNQNPQSNRYDQSTAVLEGALKIGGSTFRAVTGHIDRILATSGTRDQPTLWEWMRNEKMLQRS